jgi:methylated-DNA-[protein]-cysteine S-methyltransferase
MANQLQYTGMLCFDSPLGWLRVTSTAGGVREVWFCDTGKEERGKEGLEGLSPDTRCMETQKQLEEYFEGRRTSFDLPLDLAGTGFQRAVWAELLRVPFGRTISYRDLSIRIGNVKAIRAVGHANGQNPLPILVPCHRVIGADGSLTGYGGGLWRKKILLSLEKCLPPDLGF